MNYLNFDHNISMAFKSRQYLGENQILAPTASIDSFTAYPLPPPHYFTILLLLSTAMWAR